MSECKITLYRICFGPHVVIDNEIQWTFQHAEEVVGPHPPTVASATLDTNFIDFVNYHWCRVKNLYPDPHNGPPQCHMLLSHLINNNKSDVFSMKTGMCMNEMKFVSNGIDLNNKNIDLFTPIVDAIPTTAVKVIACGCDGITHVTSQYWDITIDEPRINIITISKS